MSIDFLLFIDHYLWLSQTSMYKVMAIHYVLWQAWSFMWPSPSSSPQLILSVLVLAICSYRMLYAAAFCSWIDMLWGCWCTSLPSLMHGLTHGLHFLVLCSKHLSNSWQNKAATNWTSAWILLFSFLRPSHKNKTVNTLNMQLTTQCKFCLFLCLGKWLVAYNLMAWDTHFQ